MWRPSAGALLGFQIRFLTCILLSSLRHILIPVHPSYSADVHPSNLNHLPLTALLQTIDRPPAAVTMNQDIAFMVCAEVRAHDLNPRKLAYPPYSSTSLAWDQIYSQPHRPQHVAAVPWLYRSLTLDFDNSKSLLAARLLQSLLKTDNE